MMAMAEPATRPGGINSRGMLVVIFRESYPVRNLAISWKPSGGIFGRSSWCESSSIQHADTGEPQDEAELESPRPPPHSSSLWQCWAFLWLELQLWWCHLRSPRVMGTCPTEAAGWDGWTSIQPGCSWPTARAAGSLGSAAASGMGGCMEVWSFSVVLGCAASSFGDPMLGVAPSRTVWSLKVVKGLKAHLNSWTHLAKMHLSPGRGRLAFSAQYWRAWA